jgi:type I restriction enzyme S subunit
MREVNGYTVNRFPEHWKVVRLGDYAKTEKGKKPKQLSKTKTKQYSIPYVNIKAFERNEIDEYTDGIGCVLCQDDDFLMVWDGSRSGYVGKAIAGALGSTLVRISLPEVYHDYAYYFLQSKFVEINTRAKGVGIPHVDPNLVWNYKFPLPPLNEQQQIVSKIEELFSELDKSIEQLKTAQQQLKVYRQSILKWAFEGKLTNENVKDGELPAGWKVKSLIDVCEKIQDGSHFSPKKQYYEKADNRFLYITAKNIRTNYMDLSNVVYVDKEFHESIFQRCNPEYGDVLLTKDGVNTGDVTLNILREPFSLLSSVCLLKTKREHLTPTFLKYYIQSPIGNKNIVGEMTGTAIKRIILRRIKDAEIIIPPTKEQELIVQEIESRFSVADKLEETITNSLQQAEALRQSILKITFEGRIA